MYGGFEKWGLNSQHVWLCLLDQNEMRPMVYLDLTCCWSVNKETSIKAFRKMPSEKSISLLWDVESTVPDAEGWGLFSA